MRNITFRGKSIDTNEWVYGGLVHQTDYYGTSVDRYFIIDGTSTLDYDIGEATEVIPRTVGQLTGMYIHQDKRILFDGDIVDVFIISTDGKSIGYRSVVRYVGSQFLFWCPSEHRNFYDRRYSHLEYVGNMYDNPELLEVHHE